MKIKVETTIELRGRDLKALKMYYAEMADDDETFRDFVKSHCASWAQGFVEQTVHNYLPYTIGDLQPDGNGGYALEKGAL